MQCGVSLQINIFVQENLGELLCGTVLRVRRIGCYRFKSTVSITLSLCSFISYILIQTIHFICYLYPESMAMMMEKSSGSYL